MFPLIPSRGSQIQYVTEWTPRANCRVLVRNARAAKSKCVTDADKDSDLGLLGCQGGFSKLARLFWGSWGIYMTVME